MIQKFIFVLTMLGLSGCLMTTEQGELMKRDILSLRMQISSLKRGHEQDNARLIDRVSKLENELEAFSSKLLALDKSAHRGAVDLSLEVSAMKRELEKLRGTLDLQQLRIEKFNETVQQTSRVDSEPAKQKEKEPDKEASKATAVAEKSTPAAAPKKPEPPRGKKAMLEEAEKLQHAKSFSDAASLYKKLIKRWPKTAGVTDVAYWGLGKSLAGQKEHRRAIIEYNRILEQFPKSDYVDDALYLISESFLALEYPDDARAFLEELITRHPKSPLRNRAKKKLKSLKTNSKR